jgi:hypothetical protein
MERVKKPPVKAPKVETPRVGNVRFVQINRNFCNFPIARDRRAKVRWRKSKDRTLWVADLPGDARIRLIYRSDTAAENLLCPDGFGMAFLFTLLRTAQIAGCGEIVFLSRSELLAAMGANARDGRNHAKLNEALAIWKKLRIRFTQWWDPNGIEDLGTNAQRAVRGKGKVNKRLPPPILWIEEDRDGLQVKLNPQWLALGKRYYIQAPIPLLYRAPTQNLILWLLCAPKKQIEGDKFTQAKTKRQLCRMMGVSHGRRNIRLKQAISDALKYYRDHGGELVPARDQERLGFMIVKPPRLSSPTNSRDDAGLVDAMFETSGAEERSKTKSMLIEKQAPSVFDGEDPLAVVHEKDEEDEEGRLSHVLVLRNGEETNKYAHARMLREREQGLRDWQGDRIDVRA